MENNNKESFKLLGMSASGTDSGSEVPEFVLAPPRKKRIKRRLRGSSTNRKRQTTPPCNCQGKTVGLALATVLLSCWLLTVTWLAFVLHGELKRLDTDVHHVVAVNEGVPDALQKCHALSKELQQNQTSLFNNLAALSHQLDNFSAQLFGVQSGLHDIEERLKAAPELVNLPRDVQSLTTSVASFGSQIRDLNTTVTVLKSDNNQLLDASKNLFENVTSLKQKVAQLMNLTQIPQTPSPQDNTEKEALISTISQLSSNISIVNNTLNKQLLWVLEDQKKHHKTIDELRESGQNVSARLSTLSNECVTSATHLALNSTVSKLLVQVNNDENEQGSLQRQVSQLQVHLDQIDNNTTLLETHINKIDKMVHNLLLQGSESPTSQPIGESYSTYNPSNGKE